MSKFWDVGQINQFSEGTSFDFEDFGSPFYKQMRVNAVGQTILRTRLQGQILIGVTSPAGFGLSFDFEPLAATSLFFGLWTDPTQAAGGAPQLGPASPYDANWLQHGFMSCVHMSTPYVDGTGSTRCSALFRMDTGLSESQGQRGPAKVASDVILTWTFFNPIEEYWRFSVAGQTGLFAGGIGVHMLVDG